MSKFLLPPISSKGLTEREWVSLFISKSDQNATIDPVELESTQEILQSMLSSTLPDLKLTPDARILLRAFLKSHPKRPYRKMHLSA